MADITLDAAHSALLVMDFQTSIVERFATGGEALLSATARAIACARSKGMRVIYVVVGFRPGYPEISSRNKVFNRVRSTGPIMPDIHPSVQPIGDEVVVTKHRVGSFTGTDLDMILRANHIHALMLCGLATSGVVLSTLCSAVDLDYEIVVLRDCCADQDADTHAALMGNFFPRRAEVIGSEEFLRALNA